MTCLKNHLLNIALKDSKLTDKIFKSNNSIHVIKSFQLTTRKLYYL